MGTLERKYRKTLASRGQKQARQKGVIVTLSPTSSPLSAALSASQKKSRARPVDQSWVHDTLRKVPKRELELERLYAAKLTELAQLQSSVREPVQQLQHLLAEMEGINPNIHPLRPVVFQRWRDTLTQQLQKLKEVSESNVAPDRH